MYYVIMKFLDISTACTQPMKFLHLDEPSRKSIAIDNYYMIVYLQNYAPMSFE